MKAGAKLGQDKRFGSRERQIEYTADRNTIEGGNAYMKDDSKEQLAAAGRRRVRGIAAQTFFVGLLVVSANLRKLQAASGTRRVGRVRNRRRAGSSTAGEG
jgi:hypothetical protein